MDFELLTNRDVLDPDVNLAIRLIPDTQENTLTIEDAGIGMTAEEMVTGSWAQLPIQERASSSRLPAGERAERHDDLIGQFGVGFYSAFMVAEWIRVTSLV